MTVDSTPVKFTPALPGQPATDIRAISRDRPVFRAEPHEAVVKVEDRQYGSQEVLHLRMQQEDQLRRSLGSSFALELIVYPVIYYLWKGWRLPDSTEAAPPAGS